MDDCIAIGVVYVYKTFRSQLKFKQDPSNRCPPIPNPLTDLNMTPGQRHSIENGPIPGSYWSFKAYPNNRIQLDQQLSAGQSIGFVDAQGGVKIIAQAGSVRIVEPPNACIQDSTTLPSDNSSYIPYVPSPSGIYEMAVMMPGRGCEHRTPVLVDDLMTISPFIPKPPKAFEINECMVELVGLRFYFPGEFGDTDAIELYRPVSPEFPIDNRGIVAYPQRVQLKPKQQILACFKTQDKGLTQRIIYIRAIVANESNSYTVVSTPMSFLCKPGTNASFLSMYNGNVGYVRLEMDFQNLQIALHKTSSTTYPGGPSDIARITTLSPVGPYTTDWTWQICTADPQDPSTLWRDIAKTHVRLYMTLDPPGFPWNTTEAQMVFGIRPKAAPFWGLVALACERAAGSNTAIEAVTKITEWVINSDYFAYASGVATLCTPIGHPPTGVKVNGARFMQAIAGLRGHRIWTDCLDLAHVIMLMANSIGCKVKIGLITPKEGPTFNTKPCILLGATTASTNSFTFHAVAYLDDSVSPGSVLIFDPCLRFTDNGFSFNSLWGMATSFPWRYPFSRQHLSKWAASLKLPPKGLVLGMDRDAYLRQLLQDPSACTFSDFTENELIEFF